jgi:hypothetical protein
MQHKPLTATVRALDIFTFNLIIREQWALVFQYVHKGRMTLYYVFIMTSTCLYSKVIFFDTQRLLRKLEFILFNMILASVLD